MVDQHLPIGSGARADADRRNVKSLSDSAGQLGWDSFEDEAESSRLLERLGVGQDASGLRLALALDLEAAHLVDELRCEAEVADHGDAMLRQPARDLDGRAAAFELDRMHASFLQKTAGAGDRLLD